MQVDNDTLRFGIGILLGAVGWCLNRLVRHIERLEDEQKTQGERISSIEGYLQRAQAAHSGI